MAPKLYNLIPKSIKSENKINTFKRKLDAFLIKIPDLPPISGYIRANSNSLTEWVASIQEAKRSLVSNSSDDPNLMPEVPSFLSNTAVASTVHGAP